MLMLVDLMPMDVCAFVRSLVLMRVKAVDLKSTCQIQSAKLRHIIPQHNKYLFCNIPCGEFFVIFMLSRYTCIAYCGYLNSDTVNTRPDILGFRMNTSL